MFELSQEYMNNFIDNLRNDQNVWGAICAFLRSVYSVEKHGNKLILDEFFVTSDNHFVFPIIYLRLHWRSTGFYE